jgi:hypothetical protein
MVTGAAGRGQVAADGRIRLVAGLANTSGIKATASGAPRPLRKGVQSGGGDWRAPS